MIDVGGNKFQNVAIPLIFLDRYFLVETFAQFRQWQSLTGS
ncbi:MAG: hypothetical protein WAR40_06910 [Desulfomonilia bacterium]|jgi:hypothetical protein